MQYKWKIEYRCAWRNVWANWSIFRSIWKFQKCFTSRRKRIALRTAPSYRIDSKCSRWKVRWWINRMLILRNASDLKWAKLGSCTRWQVFRLKLNMNPASKYQGQPSNNCCCQMVRLGVQRMRFSTKRGIPSRSRLLIGRISISPLPRFSSNS